MISTAIYKFDIHGTQWDVAHLYEHLLIEAWHDELIKNGYGNALFGWVTGETFEDFLFFDAGFYDPGVAKLFDTFIYSGPSFSVKNIEKSLAVIGAEEGVEFTVTDMDILYAEIQRLSSHSAPSASIKDLPILLQFQKKANLYRDVSLVIAANDLSDVEQKLFLRFKAMLIDIINRAIASKYIAYGQGHSEFAKRDENIAYMSKITLKKGQGTLAQLADNLQSVVRDFPVEENWSQIATHIKVYASEPLWRASSIEYYRETGITTTPIEIANLATIENVQSLFSKISIEARLHDDLHDKWIK